MHNQYILCFCNTEFWKAFSKWKLCYFLKMKERLKIIDPECLSVGAYSWSLLRHLEYGYPGWSSNILLWLPHFCSVSLPHLWQVIFDGVPSCRCWRCPAWERWTLLFILWRFLDFHFFSTQCGTQPLEVPPCGFVRVPPALSVLSISLASHAILTRDFHPKLYFNN